LHTAHSDHGIDAGAPDADNSAARTEPAVPAPTTIKS
jgi:hypothetical protein